MCEFRSEERGGWLRLFGERDELVTQEPVPSAEAAYARAWELSDSLAEPRAKRA